METKSSISDVEIFGLFYRFSKDSSLLQGILGTEFYEKLYIIWRVGERT